MLIQWLSASISLCVCQALTEPLRRQLYQPPVSKHFLTSTIVSGFGSVRQSLDGFSFSLYSTLCLHISFYVYFVPLLKRTKASTLRFSFFMGITGSVNYILGIPRFWANIHLSGSTYHVCSLVTGLPYSV